MLPSHKVHILVAIQANSEVVDRKKLFPELHMDNSLDYLPCHESMIIPI